MTARNEAPHVVIVGGYLSVPLAYWPMRARLLDRGATEVSIARLHWPDWMVVGFAGFGPAMLRAARAVREARRRSTVPLLVVGHSAGGFLTRLAMSPEPFEGRHAGVSDDVGCLVTLGTPHRIRPAIPYWLDHPGVRATRYLDEVTPGAWHAPTTGYLTVGSTLVPATDAAPTYAVKSLVGRVMTRMVGQTSGVAGDGIVGDDLSRLDGVRHIALPDVLHGTVGGPWYGDAHVIDRWWPAALEEWRSALAARERRLDVSPAASSDPAVGVTAHPPADSSRSSDRIDPD